MIEVFFRYRVHPAQVRAFEHAYGPTGPWADLFRRHPGFVRTRLFRHKEESDVYVTIDVWESKAAFDEFRQQNADAYNQLDSRLALLKLEELFLGYYEGPDEYHAPLDALA
ncbi:MAG TPA: antibiotic biosynthesis monooxygenase family protein [Candidatus Acidoferrales bacterium]|nr:antibiotic biosynthesis monooxygenase family protein [Candidatus Acidoferrales bacterium]